MDGMTGHLHLPRIQCRGCMLLQAIELTRHEWLGVALLFEEYGVAVLFEHVYLVGFQGWGGTNSWEDHGWQTWQETDDVRMRAHRMKQECVVVCLFV